MSDDLQDSPMRATLQEQLNLALQRAALSVQQHAGGFPEAQWTLVVADKKTNQFVGYLSLMPFEVNRSPEWEKASRWLFSKGMRTARYTKDGFNNVLRFSIAVPPTTDLGRVSDFPLNTEGWRSELIPFLKSLAILLDTHCPSSIIDPAPEIWFKDDEQ